MNHEGKSVYTPCFRYSHTDGIGYELKQITDISFKRRSELVV
jgi:hypothetical protein